MFVYLGNHTFSDIDECKTQDACPDNAYCENTDGSYTCTCKSGFYKNTTACVKGIGIS